MQRYDIILRLRGGFNELPKRNITAAEVHVLDHMHREPGNAAITKIRETTKDRTNEKLEYGRLVAIYGPKIIKELFGAGIDPKLPKEYTPPAIETVAEVDPFSEMDNDGTQEV